MVNDIGLSRLEDRKNAISDVVSRPFQRTFCRITCPEIQLLFNEEVARPRKRGPPPPVFEVRIAPDMVNVQMSGQHEINIVDADASCSKSIKPAESGVIELGSRSLLAVANTRVHQ
jgi:hypothetical protein